MLVRFWALPEIGFNFARATWGQGYASEAMAAFIDRRDRGGRTALWMAAANGHAAVVEYLIARGVSPLKIMVNFASAADFVADNSTAEGRRENQRVDIEVVYIPTY